MMKRSGNSIVEVLVGISIAALLIVSIGNLVSGVNKTGKVAANKTQALAYARESLEVMAAIARTEFECSVGSAGCTCAPQSGYVTCWQTCPLTVPACSATYHLTSGSGAWHLAAGSEAAGNYTRLLSVTSIGGNSNLKNIIATVSWTESTRTRTVTQSTVLSGWKQ